MVLIKNISQLVKYQKVKLENHFYEMLTATVSHEMRTPLNAIISLILNVERFVKDDRGRKLIKVIQNSASCQ